MTLTIVEHHGGDSSGAIVAPDVIGPTHADDASLSDTAIDTLKRS